MHRMKDFTLEMKTFSWSSVGIGIAFGIASVLWLGFIFNDTVIEIALTLAVSYIAYFTVSSFPNQDAFEIYLFPCLNGKQNVTLHIS